MSVATLPPPQVSSNSDGTQTIVSYRINDAGKKVKVTKRISVAVEEAQTPESRRSWPKYGEAALEQVKPQRGDEITLRLFPKTANPSKEDQGGEEKKTQFKRVSCKFCQGDHLSFKCPIKDKMATAMDPLGGPGSVAGAPGAQGSVPPPGVGMPSALGAAAGGKYVPPALRGGPPGIAGGKYVPPGMRAGGPGVPGMGPGMGGMGAGDRDESTTLRVSNLPDEISEQDLRTNFSKIARVMRCHLARNKATGRSRGFAFIVYTTREEAERAKRTFDGVAVENMIMHVDFAQPRE